MRNLLILNSSPRGERSQSRRLTEVFVKYIGELADNCSVVYRDLNETNVPHMSEDWIAGAFRPESERTIEQAEALKLSDELIAELKVADIIVIGAPMHNWSITSSLKAYIDQILRVNETWVLDRQNVQNPYIGLLKNKTLFLLLSRGAQGYEQGQYNEHMNFQAPYLRTVFNIIGITDIHEVAVNGEAFSPEDFARSIKNSQLMIRELLLKYFPE